MALSRRIVLLGIFTVLFILAPMLSPTTVVADTSDVQWIKATDAWQLEQNGWSNVTVGINKDSGEMAFVCRAYIDSRPRDLGYHPGKFHFVTLNGQKMAVCFVPYYGREIMFGRESFEVLMSRNNALQWELGPVSYDYLLRDTSSPTSTVYYPQSGTSYLMWSCAINYDTAGFHAGKLIFLNGRNGKGICYIPYGGGEWGYTDNYTVLTGIITR